MTWIILLVAVGITLIALEIIIPGGILGAIGAICILAGCVLSFSEFGALGGLISTSVILTLTGITIWLVIRVFSKTSLGQRAFLTKSVSAVSSTYGAEAKQLIGKTGVAQTTLAPSGYITIEGKRYEAFCQSGLIESGTALKVVDADNFRLIVSADTGSNHSTEN